MFFFVAVYIWSGAWAVSPGYATLAECRAATVAVSTAPVEREEPTVTSDCFTQERSK